MSEQWAALVAEVQKNKRSRVIWFTFAAFALAPLMGGMIMLVLQNPGNMEGAGALRTKAALMSYSADWPSFLDLLSQAMGVGGVLVFGFVASWLFGREYSDGTAKDLLALPASRTGILNAKFACYVLWCAGLALGNLLLGAAVGAVLALPGWETAFLVAGLKSYGVTTLLTAALGTPVGFFALAGRGYLAPLGVVAVTLVLAQIIAALGAGAYFPWALPGLYSGAGGAYRAQLGTGNYLLLGLTSLAGYVAAVLWWKHADHTK
jgi:ABC-2 type transport system permease protein